MPTRAPGFIFRQRSGQALVEYVLVVAMVAVGLVLVMLHFRSGAGNALSGANCQIASAGGGSPDAGCDANAGGATPGSPGGGAGDHPGYGWGQRPPEPGPPPGIPGQGNGPPGPPGGGNGPH